MLVLLSFLRLFSSVAVFCVLVDFGLARGCVAYDASRSNSFRFSRTSRTKLATFATFVVWFLFIYFLLLFIRCALPTADRNYSVCAPMYGLQSHLRFRLLKRLLLFGDNNSTSTMPMILRVCVRGACVFAFAIIDADAVVLCVSFVLRGSFHRPNRFIIVFILLFSFVAKPFFVYCVCVRFVVSAIGHCVGVDHIAMFPSTQSY